MHDEPFTNETIELMMDHVSVRSFTDEPVPDGMVDAIIAASRRAPTSSNWQTYSIIVIRDPQTKERLAEAAGGQRHVIESQVFFAFAADVHRLEQAGSLHGLSPAGGFNQMLVSVVDAAIVGEAAQIAAESFGLGAVMVGGMRRHPEQVAELLELPDGVFVVFGMSVGWPKDDPRAAGRKPRLPDEMVVHRERYAEPDIERLLAEYNAKLAAFYRRRGRNLDDDAWSGPVARGASEPKYTKVRPFLESHGFDLS